MNQVLETLSTHRSIRKFSGRPVEPDLLKSLISAAQCASTSHHVQACSIIQVIDPDNRKKIADMAGPQPWVVSAPVFHQDRFPKAPDLNTLADYDRVIKNYYEKRSPKLKDRTWTCQMADFTSQVIRPHMREFLEKKGFFRQ